ncbi:MAG: T9SS type A sorting domain-containing protein [Saprospiraceae bacterium]|nr:T9SS type A sorting domain-containing protein [Saprospiraceae bacterium]
MWKVFQVFPNPVSSSATVQIRLNESMDAILTVTNLMGQTMINQNIKLNAGDNNFPVEMSDLPAGLYLLSVKSGSDIITYKVQKY